MGTALRLELGGQVTVDDGRRSDLLGPLTTLTVYGRRLGPRSVGEIMAGPEAAPWEYVAVDINPADAARVALALALRLDRQALYDFELQILEELHRRVPGAAGEKGDEPT
jgi:hypothetical protein